MAEFVMPTLGSDMTEGILVEWKKKVGDRVVKSEIIAEVDTEKAAIEIESFHTGVIEQLLAKPGERVPVGTVMAIIREERTQAIPAVQAPASPPPSQTVSPKDPVSSPPHTPPPIAAPVTEPGRLRISPAARKLAGELGVDPALVQGTGPGGAITLDDIQHSAQAQRQQRSAPCPCLHRRSRRSPGQDATDHCSSHGTIEAGDPPLLSEHHHRHGPGYDVAQRRKPQTVGDGSAAIRRLAY